MAGNEGHESAHAKENRGSVSELLQRVVRRVNLGFGAKEEVMARHGPHAFDIARREKHLAPMAGYNLVDHVHESAANEDPHEREVPLQRAPQPAPDGELRG